MDPRRRWRLRMDPMRRSILVLGLVLVFGGVVDSVAVDSVVVDDGGGGDGGNGDVLSPPSSNVGIEIISSNGGVGAGVNVLLFCRKILDIATAAAAVATGPN